MHNLSCGVCLRTSALVGLLVLLSTGMSFRHLTLIDSTPEADEAITESPTMVQLWFNQPVERALTAIRVEGPAGPVELGALEEVEGDGSSVGAPVPTPLDPGPYVVRWRAAGSDGHVVRGRFAFVMDSAQP